MQLILQEKEIQEILVQLQQKKLGLIHSGMCQSKDDDVKVESMINFGQLIIVQFVGPKTRVREKKEMDELEGKMEPLHYF